MTRTLTVCMRLANDHSVEEHMRPQMVVAVGVQVVRGDEALLRCKRSRHSFHAPPGKGVKPPSGAASPTEGLGTWVQRKKLAKSLM